MEKSNSTKEKFTVTSFSHIILYSSRITTLSKTCRRKTITSQLQFFENIIFCQILHVYMTRYHIDNLCRVVATTDSNLDAAVGKYAKFGKKWLQFSHIAMYSITTGESFSNIYVSINLYIAFLVYYYESNQIWLRQGDEHVSLALILYVIYSRLPNLILSQHSRLSYHNNISVQK